MTDHPFSNLDGYSYMRLTTFRKNGTPVSVSVWFVRHGDRIYFTTHPNTWKVKRIARNPRVEVGPCTMTGKPLGPAVPGLARRLDDPAEAAAAKRVLFAKYRPLVYLIEAIEGLQKRIGRHTERYMYEIKPA
jgi:uncharacterized protein